MNMLKLTWSCDVRKFGSISCYAVHCTYTQEWKLNTICKVLDHYLVTRMNSKYDSVWRKLHIAAATPAPVLNHLKLLVSIIWSSVNNFFFNTWPKESTWHEKQTEKKLSNNITTSVNTQNSITDTIKIAKVIKQKGVGQKWLR